MGTRLQELTAMVTFERHRFGQAEPFTVVLEAAAVDGGGDSGEDFIVLKGQTDDGGPQVYLTYRFYGLWSEYQNQRTGQVERQFKFHTFVSAAPHGRAGIIKYLSFAPNIGNVFATTLWDKFKGDAVKILREKPHVASAACHRLSPAAAEEAAEWLVREQALEDCSIELVDLLEGHGFPKSTVKQAVKLWGNRAAQIIRQNPMLMMRRLRGCGFKRCDALYLELGHPPARLKRQSLCAWYHVACNTSGDTWNYIKVVEIGLSGAIAGADVRFEQALELALRSGMLAAVRTEGVDSPLDWDGSTLWVADGRKARNENRLAGYIVEALEEV
jgi:hypothetical protein